jgi:hypothetical protein
LAGSNLDNSRSHRALPVSGEETANHVPHGNSDNGVFQRLAAYAIGLSPLLWQADLTAMSPDQPSALQQPPAAKAPLEPGESTKPAAQADDEPEVDINEVLRKLSENPLPAAPPEPECIQRLMREGLLTEKQCESAGHVMSGVDFAYSWGMTSVQESIPENKSERQSYSLYARTLLANDLPENDEELLNWQRQVRALGLADPNAVTMTNPASGVSDALCTTSDRLVAGWLQRFDSWEESDQPLDALREKLQELYSFQFAVHPNNQPAILARFARTENALQEISSTKILEHLEVGLAFDREHALGERAESLEISKKWKKKLTAEQGFSHTDEGSFYQPTAGGSLDTIWRVERAADFFGGNYFTLRKSDAAEVFISVEEDVFKEALKKGTLTQFSDEALLHAQREKKGVEQLKEFHPKTGQKVTHLRVFPDSYNGTLSHTYLDSMLLTVGLSRAFGEEFSSPMPIFSDNPLPEIRKNLNALCTNTDQDHFIYLDLNCHGSREQLLFEEPIEAKELVELAKDFPECTFFVSTIACFGGGLIDKVDALIEGDSDVQSRLIVNTQTTRRLPNTLASVAKVGEEGRVLSGTPAQREFLKALFKGDVSTIGEALYRADQEVKKYRNLNGETLLDGNRVSQMEKPSAATVIFG